MGGFRLKIELQENKNIYRTLDVPAKLNFDYLHNIIQDIFLFEDICEYHFNIGKNYQCETLEKYLKDEKNFEYVCFNSNYNWIFKIMVKQLEEDIVVPVIIDYKGNKVYENCKTEKSKLVIDNSSFDDFPLNYINRHLFKYVVEEVINNNEICIKYIDALRKIRKILDNKIFDIHLKYKVNSNTVIYWIIIKTTEGYILELFDEYNQMLEGFYNLYLGEINHAFGRFYTFLLTNQKMDNKNMLDDEGKISAFYNEPGYLPCLIDITKGKEILKWLNELITILEYDQNTCEIDEMIEIELKDSIFKDSYVFVHEPKINLNEFDNGYRGKESINNMFKINERLCADIVALPLIDDELQLYAIVATKRDYIMKEIFLPDKKNMMETLVDILIEFFNQYGISDGVCVGNLNILYMLHGFLSENGILIKEDNIDIEIAIAIGDALGLENDYDDVLLEQLLEEYENKTDEEIESELEQLLVETKLIN